MKLLDLTNRGGPQALAARARGGRRSETLLHPARPAGTRPPRRRRTSTAAATAGTSTAVTTAPARTAAPSPCEAADAEAVRAYGPGRPCEYLGWCILPPEATAALDMTDTDTLCRLGEAVVARQFTKRDPRAARLHIGAAGIRVREAGRASTADGGGTVLLNATTGSVVSLISSSTSDTVCLVAQTKNERGETALGCDVIRLGPAERAAPAGRAGRRGWALGAALGAVRRGKRRPVDGFARDFDHLIRQQLHNALHEAHTRGAKTPPARATPPGATAC